jgi:hypothetical protein
MEGRDRGAAVVAGQGPGSPHDSGIDVEMVRRNGRHPTPSLD